MPIQRPLSRRVVSAWYVWACLTAFALLARAFVPTGYMPAFDALKAGKLEITFCTVGGGTQTLALDLLTGADAEHDVDKAALAECPFGILATQAILPGTPALVPVHLSMHTVVTRVVPTSRPPLPAHGPPLGSRAPPLPLG